MTLAFLLWLVKMLLVGFALAPAQSSGQPQFNGDRLSWAEVHELAEPHDWPAVRMTDVFVLCESLGFTRAVSPTLDVGIAQVNVPLHWRRFDVFRLIYDPAYNMQAAAAIYAGGGEGRWMCAAEVAPRED